MTIGPIYLGRSQVNEIVCSVLPRIPPRLCCHNPSVNIRGTARPGVFQFFLNGDSLDFVSLKEGNNVRTIQDALNNITGRNVIKIVAITW